MSAVAKFVGGPEDGRERVMKGIPDRISFDVGTYWLSAFKGRTAIFRWEPVPSREELEDMPTQPMAHPGLPFKGL